MPADAKPLFRPDAVRPKLAGFALPASAAANRAKLAKWAKLLGPKAPQTFKETELLADFVRDVFADLLGYAPPPADPYTLKTQPHVQVDGKFADAALGRFGGGQEAVAVVLEGKGPRDPLDRPFAGRKASAVDQALKYAVQLRIDWYLVTNLRELRLHHKGHDTLTYERFDTARAAAADDELTRLVYLLGAERILGPAGNHLDALLADSKKIGRELTNAYYADYRALREHTFARLRVANPGRPPAELLAATQKILDRVLFVSFCEDRRLMPVGIVAKTFAHADPFHPRPVWDNFVALFRAVNDGSDRLDVSKYNGGLFKDDPALNSLTVPDDVCLGFKKLADYEYGENPTADRLIDVEILGHIFEQSITDLEELHRAAAAGDDPAAAPAVSKRKKEGAFYTPDFVTRYIVQETLGPVLRDRFETLRADHEAAAPKAVRKVLAEPAAFDPAAVKPAQAKVLVAFWNAWRESLETVRVVDPACGSGAFLIEAFDQMFEQYRRAEAYLTSLGVPPGLFEAKKTILTKNLFGMDLNEEAVEIAKLSCWIKTAEVGKVLTTLDDNIVRGNSVVGDPTGPLTAWRTRFPAAFAAGGFDAVIGNPPYVRQEWIKADKPYLEKHYKAYDGVADLYVYFYELGLNILKPGGRLGFIVTNKWMKAGYGEPLRALYGESAWVESVVDFGHAKQIFPDADVFPSILVARKPTAEPPPELARVCVIPREQLRIDDLSRQIVAEGAAVPLARFGPAAWNLEPPGVAALMAKIKANGVPLKEYAGVVPLYGIKTGFNDAFLIDAATKTKLVAADPDSESLFRPYLRGQDIDRWQAEWNGLWMLAMKSSGNYPWPWAGKPDAEAESVFRSTYPSVYGHLNQYREQLIKRQDQGEYWWELRSCAYWERFDAPKFVIQRIAFHSCIASDIGKVLVNDSAVFFSRNDVWLLGVMNSPLMWYFMFRELPHKKDEALAMDIAYVNELPIPTPTPQQRDQVEASVRKVVALTAEQQAGRRAVLDWLHVEFEIEKPSQKLAAVAGLDAAGFAAEVRKLRGRTRPLGVADVKRLTAAHAESVAPLQALAREVAGLERRISDAVNAAFGLTPVDVALMWDTAPPRMPIPAPTA